MEKHKHRDLKQAFPSRSLGKRLSGIADAKNTGATDVGGPISLNTVDGSENNFAPPKKPWNDSIPL